MSEQAYESAKLAHAALLMAIDDGDDYGEHVGLQRHRRAVYDGQAEILTRWEKSLAEPHSLTKAARRLVELWDESADSLGPEWTALGDQMIALKNALRVAGDHIEYLSPQSTTSPSLSAKETNTRRSTRSRGLAVPTDRAQALPGSNPRNRQTV